MVLAFFAAVVVAPEALGDWHRDPKVTDGNSGVYRCTPKWARTVSGGQALCNGRRVIFRTPIIDEVQSVSISGFRQLAQKRHGFVDYRIHLGWNSDVDVGYTTDFIRFRTTDGGRHWVPQRLRRQDLNQTKPPGGAGTRPATDTRLPVKPCVWRNYARPYPHRSSAAAFGNTCIPRATAARFSL
jgi:hypothetical protein